MRPRHIALLVFICAIWGYNFIASKYAVNHFSPVFFTTLRFAGLGLLLLPWLKWQPGQMRLVLAISLFMGTFHFALMFTAIKLAKDMSVIAVVVQLGVPIASLMAWAMLGEKIRWRRGAGIALAFLGTMVMSFDPNIFSYALAVGLCIVSVTFMSFGQVLIRRIRSVDALTMQAWIGALSAPGLLALSLIFESGQWGAVVTAGWLEWGVLAYSVIGVSLIGHGGAYFLLRNYPVSVVNPGFTLAPILGIVFGVLLLDERLSERAIAGAVLTLVGVLVVTMREAQIAQQKTLPAAATPAPRGAE